MNIGDDVTINGTIVYVSKLTDTVVVRTKTGDELTVYRKDIIQPEIADMREPKGEKGD